jgi:hypothetical protein
MCLVKAEPTNRQRLTLPFSVKKPRTGRPFWAKQIRCSNRGGEPNTRRYLVVFDPTDLSASAHRG